ncbi:MAG: winged helix-turn-helix transcriptional regulator [Planctomycetes bacterium]|nr:winged helix-turn-helix transcriptional regulator [Planctomycetota bacterium]
MTDDLVSSEDPTTCATYLKALGDPVRLRIVRALQNCPLTVSDLVQILDLEMANVSHHLRVLFHADLVTVEKSGKFSYYQLNPDFFSKSSSAKSLDFGCCKLNIRT